MAAQGNDCHRLGQTERRLPASSAGVYASPASATNTRRDEPWLQSKASSLMPLSPAWQRPLGFDEGGHRSADKNIWPRNWGRAGSLSMGRSGCYPTDFSGGVLRDNPDLNKRVADMTALTRHRSMPSRGTRRCCLRSSRALFEPGRIFACPNSSFIATIHDRSQASRRHPFALQCKVHRIIISSKYLYRCYICASLSQRFLQTPGDRGRARGSVLSAHATHS